MLGHIATVSSVSDLRARGPGFNTWSGHILSFFLPLIQEGQLSVTYGSTCMCTKYWLKLRLSLPRKSVVRVTYCPNMTIAVFHGRTTTQQQQPQEFARVPIIMIVEKQRRVPIHFTFSHFTSIGNCRYEYFVKKEKETVNVEKGSQFLQQVNLSSS